MGAMPRHDPVPRKSPLRLRPRRRGLGALQGDHEVDGGGRSGHRRCSRSSYLKSFGDPVPIHMVIATAAGVGLTMLVGTGLMGLVSSRSRSGHDEAAGRAAEDEHDR